MGDGAAVVARLIPKLGKRTLKDLPTETELSRALSKPDQARLPIRWPKNLLRLYAIGRPRERSYGRLFPTWPE